MNDILSSFPRSAVNVIEAFRKIGEQYNNDMITLGELCFLLSNEGLNVLSVDNTFIEAKVKLYDFGGSEDPVQMSLNLRTMAINFELQAPSEL